MSHFISEAGGTSAIVTIVFGTVEEPKCHILYSQLEVYCITL